MDNTTGLKLAVGRVYQAKKVAGVGLFPCFYNDRQIVWLGLDQVQYDSPTVKRGRKYPRVTVEQFLKWADKDVTDLMPPNDWRELCRPSGEPKDGRENQQGGQNS